tara:strand:+ start:182 stop:469 length:288 start_codon:yes stop_codon:yes gene_type:complete
VLFAVRFDVVYVIKLVLIVTLLEVELSSLDEEVVSEVELSELAQELIFRMKNKLSIIRMNRNLRLEIFFNEKDMRPLSNLNAINIISQFGIMERS